MPLMEPGSSWASTHGEKTSIPTTRIDLAKFGIGKLLSCERLTPNSSANCPVPSHLERILRASRTKSSSKDAACPFKVCRRSAAGDPHAVDPRFGCRIQCIAEQTHEIYHCHHFCVEHDGAVAVRGPGLR